MVSKKKLWNFCYCTIFTFKMTAKIPLCYKGARQFKGDNLVVTLDPYPSISCNSHRNSILERIRLPQKRPNHICCRIFIRSYNFPQNGRREDEYDFPNKNLHCQSKLHRATDSRTYLNIISRLEAFFQVTLLVNLSTPTKIFLNHLSTPTHNVLRLRYVAS